MYVLDLLHPQPTPVELQIKGQLDLSSFNPHGISVYTDEAGEVQIACSKLTVEQRSLCMKLSHLLCWTTKKCHTNANSVKYQIYLIQMSHKSYDK